MAITHRTEPEAAFATTSCLLGGLTSGQRPGCFVASCPLGELADEGLLCENAKLTRVRVKDRLNQLVDAWSAHFDMDHLKGFNNPAKQFTRRWNFHLFERPENLAFELAPYVISILYYRGKLRPVGVVYRSSPSTSCSPAVLCVWRASRTSPCSATLPSPSHPR